MEFDFLTRDYLIEYLKDVIIINWSDNEMKYLSELYNNFRHSKNISQELKQIIVAVDKIEQYNHTYQNFVSYIVSNESELAENLVYKEIAIKTVVEKIDKIKIIKQESKMLLTIEAAVDVWEYLSNMLDKSINKEQEKSS